MKEKILITGGSGFIGSSVREVLKSLECEVLTIGRSKNENFVCGLNEPRLENVLKEILPNVVCHFASGSNITRAENEKEAEFNDAVVATENLLNCLARLKSKPEKIIYLSSQVVYGLPKDLPIKESHPTEPITVYGRNKLNVEKNIIKSKFNYLIFRASSVFGKKQDYSKSGVIAKFINKLQNNQSPIVFNSFDLFFDFIYVNDLAQAIVKAIQNNSIHNEIFNLGSGKPTSLKKVLDILYEYFPNAPKAELELNPLYLNKEQKGLYLDISKIQSQLKWMPKYSIEDGLKEMLVQHILAKKN